MDIYDLNMNDEHGVLLEPAAAALLLSLATKALEGFADEFGKSLGQTLGKGVGGVILNLFGINGDLSHEQLKKLLQQYADYIIKEIRLVITTNNLREYESNTESYAQTITEYVISKRTDVGSLVGLMTNVNRDISNIYSLSNGGLRGACLGVLVAASLVKMSIHVLLIEHQLRKEGEASGEMAAFKSGIEFIEARLFAIKEMILDDFNRRVEIQEFKQKLYCEIYEPPVKIMRMQDTGFINVAQLTVDGKRYVGYDRTCKGKSGEFAKVKVMALKAKSEKLTEYETKFNKPVSELILTMQKVYSLALRL